MTYSELWSRVQAIAHGLIDLGLRRRRSGRRARATRASSSRSSTSPRRRPAPIVVPVYPTNSAAECEWVLGDSGASIVVCENAGPRRPRSTRSAPTCPSLRHTIVIDGSAAGALPLADVEAAGAGGDRRRAGPAGRRRRARRRLPDHLHVGHDRASEGRRADPSRASPPGAARPPRWSCSARATSSTCTSRWPTCSPSWCRPTASRSARRSPTSAATRRRSSPSWRPSSRPCCRRCRGSSRRSTRWRCRWCRPAASRPPPMPIALGLAGSARPARP